MTLLQTSQKLSCLLLLSEQHLSFHANTETEQYIINEKALRETQTLRAGCIKPETKIFASRQTPFPGVRDG